MEQWEYTVASWKNMHRGNLNEIEKLLDDYGNAGWELVSVAVMGTGANTLNYSEFYNVMIFKRPKRSS